MLRVPFKGTIGPGRACFLTPWLIGGNVNWSSTVLGKVCFILDSTNNLNHHLMLPATYKQKL